MICKNCGANNENNSIVCFKCGKPLANNELVNNNETVVNKKNNKMPYIIIGAIIILIIVIGLISKNVMSNSNKAINNNNKNSNLPDEDESIKKRIEELKKEGYEEVEINYNIEKSTTLLGQETGFQLITNNQSYNISNLPSPYDLDDKVLMGLNDNVLIGIENNTLYFENKNEKIMSNLNDVEIVYLKTEEKAGDVYLVMYIKTLSNKIYENMCSLSVFPATMKQEISKFELYDNNLSIKFNKYYEWWYASDCTSESSILIGEDFNGEQYIVPSGIKYSDLKYSTNSRLFITNDNYLIDIFTGENINDSKVSYVLKKDSGWCDTFEYLIVFEDGTEEEF